jgi:uncharacterized protein (DUF736 family)
MQYDNTNSGALFKNDRKETDRHPDYRGDANINGKDVWVAAWIKESKNGKKFMSLSFTEKDEQKQKPVPANDNVNVLEDVPF